MGIPAARGAQTLATVSLEDKYTVESGRIFLTGTQALVRLPLMQRARDRAAGLNTGGFISGYRGSPLGGVDKALWDARKFLKNGNITFEPGLNEDLAATAVWGSQQVNLYPDATVDGVFAMWYGKGPGVDRSGDVFKHANNAGTSKHGGVLVLAGDDHTCKSSTLPHQSEYAFMDASIPVLNPAGVQEILDYGMIGWAMSRYSGLWIGMKTIAESVDSSASVYVDPLRALPVMPTDFEFPPDGVHIRWPDKPLAQEMRLHKYKLYAALAFARANKLDQIMIDSPKPRFGIVTTGKSYLDVRQALDDLGIDEDLAAEIGLRVYKVAMSWPLEREGARHFAEGLEEILVVEEKRAVIENQLKEQLYNWREDVRPRVIGKFDEEKNWILPSPDELTPARIARVIAKRIARFYKSERIDQRLAFLEAKEKQLAGLKTEIARVPTFCSGCPHNSSTKVPDGSRAVGGIGCHYMVTWMDRKTETFTQMGGEGVPWVGQSPFTKTKHIFANLGDGTYQHSGLLAIRAAIAAKVNITYKILFNDAVAMTGGQPHDVPLSVPQLTRQLSAEGVRQVRVVTDEPEKYPSDAGFAPGVTVHHRDDLDQVQRDIREIEGVTAIVYDQTCATEKRRRRKRGLMVDPPKRTIINDLVCEGCGDCGEQSNCVSILPLETEFGRKRTIDQSTCNKDFSCVKGFCPSFVTVKGGQLRKPKAAKEEAWAELPEPIVAPLSPVYSVLVTGVGGTGVVTIGALLGMAAHLDGKGVAVLDMTGLAQKGGAVYSHIRVAEKPGDIHAVRIPAGEADLVLGADALTTGTFDSLAKVRGDQTRVVLNSFESMPSDFTRKPDLRFPTGSLMQAVTEATGTGDHLQVLDATRLATALMGDSIATNAFLLGFAAQKGWLPVSLSALERAIELNGVSIGFNKKALLWGRRAAVDLAAVEAAAKPAAMGGSQKLSESLADMVARRVDFLTQYQDAAYADRYKSLVARTEAVEQHIAPTSDALTRAVARYAFKLMAIKDEYEVARLYTDGSFAKQVAAQFEGDYTLEFNLAPPMIAEKDATTGHLKKKAYGPWMLTAFKALAKLKGLRGTAFDVFGKTEERKMERRLRDEYLKRVEEVLRSVTPAKLPTAVALLSVPEQIRGFGHVKEAHVAKAEALTQKLLAEYQNPAPQTPVAAAAE